MDPSHEGDHEPIELSLQEQAEVIREAASLEGVQKLNDTLRAGLLKKIIPMKVEGHADFHPDEDGPTERMGNEKSFSYGTERDEDDGRFATEVTPLRGYINYLSIEGSRSAPSDIEGEKPNQVEAYVHYTSTTDTGEVEMDNAAFVIAHPTQNNLVLTTNAEGDIVDVMPFATYRLGNEYGVPDASEEDADPPHTVAAQDQYRAGLSDNFGIKFAAEKSPFELSELHDYVAKLYGISVTELLTKKIDIAASFNRIMNTKVFDRKVPIDGEKGVPVSPLVFKEPSA